MDETKKRSDEVAEVFNEFVQFYKQSSAEIDKELDSDDRKYAFKALALSLIVCILFVLFGKYLPIDHLNSNPHLVVYIYLFIILGFIILLVSLATLFRFQYKMMGGFI